MKKVFEFAKDIEMKPLDLVELLKELGVKVRNHMSEISSSDEQIVIRHFEQLEKESQEKQKRQDELRQTTIAGSITIESAENKSSIDKNGCQKCHKKTIMIIRGNVKDSFVCSMGAFEHIGRPISELPICDGDEISFKLCIACGQIQGKFPIDFDKVIDSLFK